MPKSEELMIMSQSKLHHACSRRLLHTLQTCASVWPVNSLRRFVGVPDMHCQGGAKGGESTIRL